MQICGGWTLVPSYLIFAFIIANAAVPVANRKLTIAACNQELSNPVTTVTANHGGQMIINPALPPSILNPLKDREASAQRG